MGKKAFITAASSKKSAPKEPPRTKAEAAPQAKIREMPHIAVLIAAFFLIPTQSRRVKASAPMRERENDHEAKSENIFIPAGKIAVYVSA